MRLLLLLLLLPHQTWVGFGHVEKGCRRGKLRHLVEVERILGLEVNLHQRRWRHLPSFRGSVFRGGRVLALRRRVVLLTTVAVGVAIAGRANRGISLGRLRRSFAGAGVELLKMKQVSRLAHARYLIESPSAQIR